MSQSYKDVRAALGTGSPPGDEVTEEEWEKAGGSKGGLSRTIFKLIHAKLGTRPNMEPELLVDPGAGTSMRTITEAVR